MRNLQAFFNPNPGGLPAEAAAVTFKEKSKKPSFIPRKMTGFYEPMIKQAHKPTLIPASYKKCKAVALNDMNVYPNMHH
jgi:hypothetical protein